MMGLEEEKESLSLVARLSFAGQNDKYLVKKLKVSGLTIARIDSYLNKLRVEIANIQFQPIQTIFQNPSQSF